MTRTILAVLLPAALLTACGQAEGEGSAGKDAASEATQQLMATTIDPQAQILWRAAGSYSDLDGHHDLRPTTEEGWLEAERAAAAVAEAGKLLEGAPYSDGRGADWQAFTRGLVELAERNRKGVAERLDDEELLRLGGELYNVCKACHEAYLPDEVPSGA